MDDPRINLLNERFQLHPEAKRSPWKLGRAFFATLLLGIFVSIGVSYAMTRIALQEDGTGRGGFFRTVASFVTSGDRALVGQDADRINILLLGVGGAGHDGPDLSDTIMMASLKPSTGDVGMLSIPRDLAIPMNEYGWRKINHANYFGELKDPGHGAQYAANVIGDLFQQDIPYYVKIDFSGFEKFIDALGGVDVYVDTSFTDTTYPLNDEQVQTISFSQGWQHLDGDRALMFARSRHGNNGEGSDFARARRQQKILLAVKERALSAQLLLHPKRISDLIGTVNDHIETNLDTWEILRLAQVAGDMKPEDIRHAVLDAGADSPLYETNLNGAYVLLPDNDDWSGVRAVAANLFESDNTESLSPANPRVAQRSVRVSIHNGTEVTGLAFRASQLLEGDGWRVVSVANADTRDWEHSVIYDFSNGQYPEELKTLKDALQADVATDVVGWLFADNVTPRTLTVDDEGLRDGSAESVDFLIILGQNSTELVRQ